MNRVLVAIVSCGKNKQRRDWQRQTWLPELKFDYKFFVGKGASTEADVVELDCGDDYKSLPDKTLAVIRWAREHGYTNLLKLDDDVYCRPERLHPPIFDYVGNTCTHKHYVSGAAYWLSARAMDACLTKWYRRSNAEDACVGDTLQQHNIYPIDDKRYRIGWSGRRDSEGEFPHPDNNVITFHMYWASFMPEMHANWDKNKQVVDLKSNYHFLQKEIEKKNPWSPRW